MSDEDDSGGTRRRFSRRSTDSEQVLDIQGPMGLRLNMKGQSQTALIVLLVAVGIGVLVYQQYGHAQAVEKAADAAIGYAQDTARAIREMTCVLSLDQAQRFEQIGRADSYCKRISK